MQIFKKYIFDRHYRKWNKSSFLIKNSLFIFNPLAYIAIYFDMASNTQIGKYSVQLFIYNSYFPTSECYYSNYDKFSEDK